MTTIAGVSVGGTAFAGETTGGPNPKPVDTYTAGSICSFSGQNDVPEGDVDPETGDIPGASCDGYASGGG